MLFLGLPGISRRLHAWVDKVPSQCAVCHAWPSQRVCNACVMRFAQPATRCRHCALRVPQGVEVCGACLRDPPLFDACIAAVDYAYPWAGALAQLGLLALGLVGVGLLRQPRGAPNAHALETAAAFWHLVDLLWLVLFVLARKGIAAQAPLYLPGRVITIAVLAVGALAFVLANAMPNLPLPESLHNLLVFNDDWGTYRGVAWRAAFGTWADGSLLRKIVGIGPGMMHTAVAAWAGDAMTARMATFYAAHNEYLEQLLTTGILGLAAWLLLVAAHLRRGERSWNTPGVAPVMLALCSYLAQAVVSIRVSMVFPLVMLLFGALAALTAPELPQPAAPAPRGKKQQKPEPLPPKNAWYFAKTVLAAVLCMAAASGIAPLLFGFLMG